MCADLTSLVIVSLEIGVSEDMRIDYVKTNIVKFKPAFIDILEGADSSLNTIIASLEVTVGSIMKHLIVRILLRKLKS